MNNCTLKQFEDENNMNPGKIIKITPLRHKKNHDTVKLHHSVVIYMNNEHAANKCITNGFHIEYTHHAGERFTPQYQIVQYFNCCDYGHRATDCKRQSRCGRCGENHNTRICQNTTVHCFQCKGLHEAWHPKCPVRIAEKDRLEKMAGNTSWRFN
jgi:hypothetical protein